MDECTTHTHTHTYTHNTHTHTRTHMQPSSLQQSEIDRYLQEELETMQRAFQIRLTQLEKRYQRQLRLEQKKNLASGATEAIPINVQLRAQRKGSSRHRRSSWHSCMSDSDTEEPGPYPLHRSGSTQGFDSDCSMEESDIEATNQSDDRFASHDNHMSVRTSGASQGNPKLVQRSQSLGVTPLGAMGGALKGGTKMWDMEPGNGARAGPPQLPPVPDALEGGRTLPFSAKALVNEKVSEHKAKILLYFQQVYTCTMSCIIQRVENRSGVTPN